MLPHAPHGDLNDPELWREIRKDPTVFKKNYWALALLAAVATLAATGRTVGQEAYSFRVQQQAAKEADSLSPTGPGRDLRSGEGASSGKRDPAPEPTRQAHL